jgi:hypothetical protein
VRFQLGLILPSWQSYCYAVWIYDKLELHIDEWFYSYLLYDSVTLAAVT